MQKGIAIFIGGMLVGMGLIGAAVLALPEGQEQAAGVLMFLSFPLPIILAFIAHRASGGTGNPFKGLVWGPTSWYFLAWLIGLAIGVVAIAITLGLGAARFDPEMTDFIAVMEQQAQAQAGPEAGDMSQARGMFKVIGWSIAAAGPTIGAWISTIMFCLSTFPWLGWLYRRLQVAGRVPALLQLMLLWLIVGSIGGLVQSPSLAPQPIWERMLLAACVSASLAPLTVWLFLRTRSAVIPALAQSTWQAMMTSATVILSDANPLLAPPFGLTASLVTLMAGLALWLLKDPGGASLAVAAVAGDGTPLTPAQLAAGAVVDTSASAAAVPDAPVTVPPPAPAEPLPETAATDSSGNTPTG